MFGIVLFIVSCHFGFPPINHGVYVEKVVNNSSEYDFQHVLKAAFSREIIKNEATGKKPMTIRVVSAKESVVAVRQGYQQWELTLRIRAGLPQAEPIEVTRKVRYVLNDETDVAFPAAREAAYRQAAERLAADAVRIILFASDTK